MSRSWTVIATELSGARHVGEVSAATAIGALQAAGHALPMSFNACQVEIYEMADPVPRSALPKEPET